MRALGRSSRWLTTLLTASALVAALAGPGAAGAASIFYVRGGGNGHGIGMSQYGAYGYALHGADYQTILAHFYRGTKLGTVDPKRVVRVLLKGGAAAFSGADAAGGRALKAGMTYSVRANADGTLTLLDSAGHKVGKKPFKAPLTVGGPGPLALAGVGSYRGSLVFRPDGAGGVETVNALGLDDYVRGVISVEMPSSWSAAALETQAVAARTYAITVAAAGSDFDVYPDTRSQMYGGVAAETPSTDAAVAATRGQVVTYNGVPVVTYFFASSGGHTESIEYAWPGSAPEPWLKGVPDPYDGAGGDPYHRWGSSMSLKTAAAKLGRDVKGSLLGIAVTKHGLSPRIITAQVVGTRGRTTVTGAELQRAFGLLTTYAWFTTITSQVGASVTPVFGVAGVARIAREAVSGVAINGTVFPGRAGAAITVQVQRHGRFVTYKRAKTARRGTYTVPVSARGTYRIQYAGLNGPAVVVP